MTSVDVSIDHFQARARRRVPRLFFDFVDGGAGRESALARNITRLNDIQMIPRAPRDIADRSSAVTLFGQDYALPVGIAPIGLANILWPGMDLALAKAARKANIAYVQSTASSSLIEDIAPAAGNMGWFQLYTSKDDSITEDLLTRAETAGYRTLVVTVDVALPGKRRRDLVNGFALPMKMGPKFASQLITRPVWLRAALGQPVPRIVNLQRYAPATGAQSLAAFMAAQISPSVDMDQISRLRDRWKGPMVVKGILHPQDAEMLADRGVDGVIVSNHGGRQLDCAIASIDALPAVVRAVGTRMEVMMDGGIRTGEDIARALALGARFVFAGRAFLYGMAATGRADAAINVLADEFDRALGQLGCRRVSDLSSAQCQGVG